MESIYSQAGIVETQFDPAHSVIHVKWHKLGVDDEIIKTCCTAQLEIIKKIKTGVIIVDTSSTKGTPSQAVQDWFGAFLFPALQTAGLKAIITVVAASAITKLAAKSWTKTGAPFGFQMFDAENLQVAQDLARKVMTDK